MTTKEFNELQAQMTDEELINNCNTELDKLCKSGGKSFRMTVPVSVKDTDMLFCELIKRFKSVKGV